MWNSWECFLVKWGRTNARDEKFRLKLLDNVQNCVQNLTPRATPLVVVFKCIFIFECPFDGLNNILWGGQNVLKIIQYTKWHNDKNETYNFSFKTCIRKLCKVKASKKLYYSVPVCFCIHSNTNQIPFIQSQCRL